MRGKRGGKEGIKLAIKWCLVLLLIVATAFLGLFVNEWKEGRIQRRWEVINVNDLLPEEVKQLQIIEQEKNEKVPLLLEKSEKDTKEQREDDIPETPEIPEIPEEERMEEEREEFWQLLVKKQRLKDTKAKEKREIIKNIGGKRDVRSVAFSAIARGVPNRTIFLTEIFDDVEWEFFSFSLDILSKKNVEVGLRVLPRLAIQTFDLQVYATCLRHPLLNCLLHDSNSLTTTHKREKGELERGKRIAEILKEGLDILFFEPDVLFLKNPFGNSFRRRKRLLLSEMAKNQSFSSSVLYIRSHPKTISFFSQLVPQNKTSDRISLFEPEERGLFFFSFLFLFKKKSFPKRKFFSRCPSEYLFFSLSWNQSTSLFSRYLSCKLSPEQI